MTAAPIKKEAGGELFEHAVTLTTVQAQMAKARAAVEATRVLLAREKQANADLRSAFAHATMVLGTIGVELPRYGLMVHSCGRIFSHEEWSRLSHVGVTEVPGGEDGPAYRLVLKHCVCGSTISKEQPL